MVQPKATCTHQKKVSQRVERLFLTIVETTSQEGLAAGGLCCQVNFYATVSREQAVCQRFAGAGSAPATA